MLPPLGIGAAPLLLGNKSGQSKNTYTHIGDTFLSSFRNWGISLNLWLCVYSLVSIPGDSVFLHLSIDKLYSHILLSQWYCLLYISITDFHFILSTGDFGSFISSPLPPAPPSFNPTLDRPAVALQLLPAPQLALTSMLCWLVSTMLLESLRQKKRRLRSPLVAEGQ